MVPALGKVIVQEPADTEFVQDVLSVLSVTVTVPVGVPVPLVGATEYEKVTVCPTTEGLGLPSFKVVVVGVPVTR